MSCFFLKVVLETQFVHVKTTCHVKLLLHMYLSKLMCPIINAYVHAWVKNSLEPKAIRLIHEV